MPLPQPPPDECANCGASIPRHARACPECGADERTGWRETSIYDGLDLPPDADEEARAARGAPLPAPRVNGIAWYWWLIGVLLVILLIASQLGAR